MRSCSKRARRTSAPAFHRRRALHAGLARLQAELAGGNSRSRARPEPSTVASRREEALTSFVQMRMSLLSRCSKITEYGRGQIALATRRDLLS